MTLGRVDWYSVVLGYGFIIPDAGSARILVWSKEIEGSEESLENGDEVVYEAIRGKEGWRRGGSPGRLRDTRRPRGDDRRGIRSRAGIVLPPVRYVETEVWPERKSR